MHRRMDRAGRMFGAVALMVLLTGTTACGEASPPSAADAGPPSTDAAAGALAFIRCLRDHDVDVDDPPADGSLLLEPETISDPDYGAAYEACRSKLPTDAVPKPAAVDPARLELLRQYAVCMREHGLTDFPDPNPGGDSVAWQPSSREAYNQAAAACAPITGVPLDPTASPRG